MVQLFALDPTVPFRYDANGVPIDGRGRHPSSRRGPAYHPDRPGTHAERKARQRQREAGVALSYATALLALVGQKGAV